MVAEALAKSFTKTMHRDSGGLRGGLQLFGELRIIELPAFGHEGGLQDGEVLWPVLLLKVAFQIGEGLLHQGESPLAVEEFLCRRSNGSFEVAVLRIAEFE